MLRRLHAPLLLLLLIGVASSGCGDSSDNPSPEAQGASAESLTRADEGRGGVRFQATVVTSLYMAERSHPPDHLGFLVQLDTHSGSLLGYDLATLAELRHDSGHTAQPLGWETLSGDSHHRSGLLYFARTLPDGQPMELSLKNVGGVPERVLRWDTLLPPLGDSPAEGTTGKD